MRNLIIIAAIGKNNELGKNNDLIWRSKEDMQFFRKKTIGHNIVMGRKTFESLPHILPNRTHIVLTKSNIELPSEIIKCCSINSFLELAKSIDEDIYVIGGSKIYNELIDFSNKMYLTEFDSLCSDADAFFPEINQDDWEIKTIETFENETPKYLRRVYTRK